MFGNATDEGCPRGIPQTHLIVRQENRGIQNALVVLDIKEGKPFQKQKATLTYQKCRLEPRVQWAPPTTPLLIANMDPTDHQTHAFIKEVTTFNVPTPAGGDPIHRALARQGLYLVNCDQHLWERAWIYVPENPYIAVTDARGQFQIKNVPPGVYTVRAWHEGWEKKGKDKDGRLEFQPMEETLQVRVKAEESTEVQFEDLHPTF